jgi:lysophospholipase L1-like esterase
MKRHRLGICTTLTAGISMLLALLQPAQAATPHQATPIVYTALGDGTGAGNFQIHHDPDSYPALLAGYMPKGSTLVNVPTSFGTLANVLAQSLPTALAAHPSVVTVWMPGVNDGKAGTSPTTYSKELDTLLTSLQGTGAHLYIGTLPDPRQVPFFIHRISPDRLQGAASYFQTLNAAITRVAARHGARVVDIYGNTTTLWGNPKFIVADGLHLAPEGAAIAASIFYQVMRQDVSL